MNDGAALPVRSRRRAWAAVAGGALLGVGYYAWLLQVPRGPFEFGYAPFTTGPLPYAPMRGFTYEQLWGHVVRALVLGPSLLLVSYGWSRLRWSTPRVTRSRAVRVACGLALGVTAFVMFVVLRGRAIVDDELVYRMQATFLGEGRLASQLGFTPPDVFSVPTRLGYTGKYLPGEPLVQVVGLFLGTPALLHLPLLALTLVAWRRALALRFDLTTADYATVALACSPMLSLTSATGLSEPTSLACLALLGLAYEWARGPSPLAGALLGAFAVGFGLATRPQAMLPAGAVLGPALALALLRRRAWVASAALFAGMLASAAAIGAYDHALAGSALKLPWYLQCSPEHYGFGRVWTTELFEHTPWTALENLGVVLVRLNAWWLGFPLSLGVLGLSVGLSRRSRAVELWYVVALALLAFEFAYYSPGDSDTGSLYHYELLLPASLLAARVLAAALSRAPTLTAAALSVHVAFGAVPFTVEQIARLDRLVRTIHTDSDAALASIPGRALLFHETRGSESLPAGWVFDSFPRRHRGQRDRVVTFPNLLPSLRARVLAAYPDRSCWYYRRNPVSERAELYRCADARALMDRGFSEDEARPLWIRPTAYDRSDYDPFHYNARNHCRDAAGLRLVPCCALAGLKELGAPVLPSAEARCVADR